MKKTLQKTTILLLILCMLFMAGSLISVNAQSTDNLSTSQNNVSIYSESYSEYIYYTDLFYAYPMYLSENSYYTAYVNDTSNLYELIYSGYEDSAAEFGTKMEYAIETVTSPSALVSFATERLGLHSNTYNEALDTANKIFVEKLLNDSTLTEVEAQYGEMNTFVNRTQKMVDLFNDLKLRTSDSQIDRTAEYYLQESFDYLWDRGVLTCLTEKQISELWIEINSEDFKINNYLNLASTEIEVAQAFVSTLIMADMKVELVDSLIASQETDTVLKQGMLRLKSQMSGGFVKFFLDNYVTNKVIDSVYSAIKECVADTDFFLTYKLACTILNIAKVIAFDWIMKVPSYNNVLAFQVLSCYSNDISNVLSKKAKSFAEGPFISDKIVEYEDLFSAYVASNKAAVQLLESIADAESKGHINEYLNIYALFTAAQEQGIETVKINDGKIIIEMPSSSTPSDVDDMLREKCSSGIKSITINNGIESKAFSSMAIQYYRAMLRGLNGSGNGLISRYKSTYETVDVYEKFIANVKNEILQTPVGERKLIDESVYSNWTYNISQNIQLRRQSDLVEKKSIYSVNDKIQGNIKVVRNGLNILENQVITIDGNLNIVGTKVTVDGHLTVEGVLYISSSADITNNGKTKVYKAFLDDMNYYSGCNSITNNGYFEIENNFEHSTNTYGNSRTGYRIIQETDEAVLAIGGDFIANAWDVCTTITNGTVIFNGNTQQIAKNLRTHDLTIDNIEGIKYITNIYVNGLYDTKGNVIDVNEYATVISNNTKFIKGYDYKNIQLQSNVDLTQSIKANITTNGYSITIPRGAEACIDGNLNIIGTKVTVNGKLIVTGKVDISNSADLTNNGTIQIGSVYLQTMNYHSGLNSITNNGYFEIINNFESSAERFGNSRTGYRIIQNTDDAILAIGGNLLANTWDVCTTITKGTVMFNGDQQQIVKNLNAPIVIIDNQSLSGVVFTTTITASRLFNHQGNDFTLYNNGSGSSFVDYDGDGLKDNVDPYPTCGEHIWNDGEITKQPTYTARGVKTYTCVDCGATKTENIPVLEHVFGPWINDNDVEHYKVCGCGEVLYADHTWNSGKVTTPATHMLTGTKVYTCIDCGATNIETIPKKSEHTYGECTKFSIEQHSKTCECGHVEYETHTWNNVEITTPATHTATGIKTYTCTDCGEIRTEIVPVVKHAHGAWTNHNAIEHKKTCECGDVVYASHAWNEGEVTTPATHTATGIKTYTCIDCGETKTEVIAKTTEHAHGAWEKHNAVEHKKTCECGDVVYASHAWNEGEVTTPATHTTTGIKTYTCVDCRATKTEVLPVTNAHSYGEWTKHNADRHARTCECGNVEYASHVWNEGEITTPATHTATGVKTYTCTDCGETKTEVIAKTTEHAHGVWTNHNAVEHKKTCECGDVEYAPHAWNAGEVTTPATHTATGIKTYTCTDCGEIKTEVIAKTTEHAYGAWTKYNSVDHKKTCECGNIEYAPHAWNNGEVTTEATHTTTGVKTYTCADCGETKTEVIPVTTQHSHSDWTKQDEALHSKTCECGDVVYGGHNWGEGSITTPASTTSEGIKTYTCTDCGATKTESIAQLPSGNGCESAVIGSFGALAAVVGIAAVTLRKKKDDE